MVAPIIAGILGIGDKRGPKVFWIKHHELLFTVAYEWVHDENARANISRERAWFYGFQGKANNWFVVKNRNASFEEQVGESTLLEFRQSVWRAAVDGQSSIVSRKEWPPSFVSYGVLEVRREKHGVCVVLSRAQDHEGGILLIARESYKRAIENDRAYSAGKFWSSGVYHYFRENVR